MVTYGTFEHTIDAKHRLAIPSEVRREMEWNAASPDTPVFLFVTLGEGNSLCLYGDEEFKKRSEQLDDDELDEREVRKHERIVYSLASRVEVDPQGRIRLPEHLIKRAKLGTNVVLIGARKRMEIHDRDVWNQYLDEVLQEQPDITMTPRRPAGQRTPRDGAGI